MARPVRPTLPEMSPWRRQPLTIPPDSLRAWLQLAVWEGWIGMLSCGAIVFGLRLITTAADQVVPLWLVFNAWCGILMFVVAAWLMWELWTAAAPKPITDDFLKLLDDSFGRNWRNPRTWPWRRMAWAYGFAIVGAALAVSLGLAASAALSSPRLAKAPTPRVDTSQRFRTATPPPRATDRTPPATH